MFSKLNASDKRFVILGAIVAVAGVLSFADPSGSWGSVVGLGILAGVGVAAIALAYFGWMAYAADKRSAPAPAIPATPPPAPPAA